MNPLVTTFVSLLALVAARPVSAACLPTISAASFNPQTTLLDSVKGIPSDHYWDVSRTGRFAVYSYLYETRIGQRVFGTPSHASEIVFSPDGRRVAEKFLALRDGRAAIALNGHTGKKYDRIDFEDPLFSSDGCHLAYVARQAGKEMLVYDGYEGKPYDRISDFTFSPDGRSFAYVAKELDGQSVLILNGAISSSNTYVVFTAFSPDSRYLTFMDMRGGPDGTIEGVFLNVYDMHKKTVERHRIGLSKYFTVRPPTFSTDSSTVGFAIAVGEKTRARAIVGTWSA